MINLGEMHTSLLEDRKKTFEVSILTESMQHTCDYTGSGLNYAHFRLIAEDKGDR